MSKFTTNQKLEAVHRRLDDHESYGSIANSLGTNKSVIMKWVRNYEAIGEEAFMRTSNRHYSLREKEAAVKFYLSGKGSLTRTCKEFKITSDSVLERWIRRYNSHELKASPGGGKSRIMTKGRKTTLEERVEIVEDHIKTGSSYNETAQKHSVSYQQIYQWYHKYLEKGIEGLKDRRGHAKPIEEMTEVERLKAENRLLKAQLENSELENLFLKKVKEIERRRF